MQATSLYKYLHIHIYVYTYDIWVCLKIRENTHQLLWLFYSGKWWLISWFSGWWTIVTYPRICTPTKTVIWSMYGLICIMEMHVITHGKYVDLVGGLDHCLFSHILWIIIPFQRGWNHQPGMLSKSMRKTHPWWNLIQQKLVNWPPQPNYRWECGGLMSVIQISLGYISIYIYIFV